MERRTRESRPISRRRATRASYPYFQLSIRAPLHRTRPLATRASSLQSCKAPRILPLSRAVWPLARPNTLPTRPLCPSTTAVSKGFARPPCESHSPRRKLGGLRAWWAADIECDPPFFVLFSRLSEAFCCCCGLLLWSSAGFTVLRENPSNNNRLHAAKWQLSTRKGLLGSRFTLTENIWLLRIEPRAPSSVVIVFLSPHCSTRIYNGGYNGSDETALWPRRLLAPADPHECQEPSEWYASLSQLQPPLALSLFKQAMSLTSPYSSVDPLVCCEA